MARSASVLCCLVFGILDLLHGSTAGPVRNVSMTQFAADCVNLYNGVMNGGRCFYVAAVLSNWTNGWDQCAKKAPGGTMAQIHTQSEYDTILNLDSFKASISQNWRMNFAWQRTTDVGEDECYVPTDKFFWCSSESCQYDPLYTGTTTWIRTVSNGDCTSPLDVYGGFYSSNRVDVEIADMNARWEVGTLCVVSIPVQKYNYYSGVCLTEVIVAKKPSTTACSCAQYCSDTPYCRSFNFWVDTGDCELFTWSAADGPKTTKDSCCWHYSYDP